MILVITIIMITTQSTPTTAPMVTPLLLLSQLQVSMYIQQYNMQSDMGDTCKNQNLFYNKVLWANFDDLFPVNLKELVITNYVVKEEML